MTYVSLSKIERDCVFCVIVEGNTEEAAGLAKIIRTWEHCMVLPMLVDYDD